MHKEFGKIVLGLETGIDGGSISILENDKQIDSASGSGKVSKSEDLLFLLEGLLERNGIRKSEIGSIAVSDAPGSLTGIRIGLSMAKGLGDALSVAVSKFSVLDAMATIPDTRGRVVCALSTKRNGVYFKEYKGAGIGLQNNPQTVYQSEPSGFAEILKKYGFRDVSIVCNRDFERISRGHKEIEDFIKGGRFYCLDGNLAGIVALAAARSSRPIT